MSETHTHEHLHADGTVHTHDHIHDGDVAHTHGEDGHEHAHTHADGTTHSHAHDHNGEHEHVHDHEHEHHHDHEHEHHHDHDHDHEHHHHDHGENCTCGCHDHEKVEKTPAQKSKAVLTYMTEHNEHHAEELEDMAYALKKEGFDVAAEKITEAVKLFNEGNDLLNKAIGAIIE